jgi:transcriptional regulator with XRE-family HTH domain
MITPQQCRAARALLDWSRKELAVKAKVSEKTIADFELGKRESYDRTLADIVKVLEKAGVVFIGRNGGGPGVRLKT